MLRILLVTGVAGALAANPTGGNAQAAQAAQACAREKTAVSEKLAAAERGLAAAKAQVAALEAKLKEETPAACPAASNAEPVSFVGVTAALRAAMAFKANVAKEAYETFVSESGRQAVDDSIAKAASSTADLLNQTQNAVADLYKAHAEKHVETVSAATMPHLEKASTIARNVYETHVEGAVHNGLNRSLTGIESVASTAAGAFDSKFDACAAVLTRHAPQMEAYIPKDTTDRIVFLLLGSFFMFVYIKSLISALMIALRAAKFSLRFCWATALFVLFLPCRLCCRKRAVVDKKKKSAFGKPNGAVKAEKAPASGKKQTRKKD